MESHKISSLKRKPLSDCTNTCHNLRSSKLTSQTLIKPIKKSSIVVTPITNSKLQNPNFNSIDNAVLSCGSNNSPNSDTVQSLPATPLSRAGDIVVRRATRLSATQTQRQNEQTRKDKGESVELTPTAQVSAYLTSRPTLRSLSVVSGYDGHISRPPAVQNREVDEQKRKDKGKMVVETPIIHISTPLTSHTQQTSSSAASGNCYLPGPSVDHSRKQDAPAKESNTKTGQEMPIEGFGPTTPRPLIIPSSDVSDEVVGRASRLSATQTQWQNEETKKDKGKSIEVTPTVQPSTYLTSRFVQRSSSTISRFGGYASRPPTVQNPELDEQTRKDKGKMVVETPMIQLSTPLTSHAMQTSSSSVASGNSYLAGPSAVHSQKQDTQAQKDNIKFGQETPNFEGFGPMTPHPLTISSSDASGTNNKEKMGLIVYNQSRASERKKYGVGSISLPFSCPAGKRTKKNGVKLDGGADGHSGSNTDPLPLRKKKRPRNKNTEPIHAMPQDEVAKLKAYFADIDAFELPEEVASESELE
ncbi:uncharacterized protein LOC141605861 [Silene latifolia]|uniref:uncharacterized protein LOC141605861 n=1 Tax=Silene latifolia TaxID=37657 RepID=UPI003D778577